MSERDPEETVDSQASLTAVGDGAGTYEAPRLTPLGNARDLLAGSTGTKFDAGTGDQTLP
jgi:hypothetical protein